MKKKSFSDFVHQKELGIEPGEGLAGYGYEGPYAYPQSPKQGEAGVPAGEPLPYKNPDEPDDRTGQVWIARDADFKKKPLATHMTKGMDKAVKEMGKPDGKVKETNPPHVWEKIPNKMQKQAPLTKFKNKMTNEEFLKASKNKTPGQLLDMISEERDEQLTPITDLFGNEFTPEPNQTIQYISGILSNSPRMMDRFVIEMKNKGGFDKLLESMMQHQQCFDGVVEMFGRPEKGKVHARQLAQSLHDKYTSALDSVDFAESVDADPGKRFSPEKDPYGMPKKSDQNAYGMPQKSDVDSYAPSQNQSGNGSVGGQGPAGGTSEPSNFGGAGMPNPTSGMPNFGKGPISPGQKKMMKAETAAGNLFSASASFPHLKREMEGACKNGNCT